MANYKKRVQVKSDELTLKDYQQLVAEESKRKREHFRRTEKLFNDVDMVLAPCKDKIEFCINFLDEKGEKIDSIFVRAKMPDGLLGSNCFANMLENARFEKQVLPSGQVRSFTAIKLESA